MKVIPVGAVRAVSQALALLPRELGSKEALVMLYSIGLQESEFKARRQMGNGPTRGLWQFEQGGGVKGVVNHAASRFWMAKLCETLKVPFTAPAVYAALEFDDVLAAGAARLLLFTDPLRLPAIEDEKGSWALYQRVWRPGKPKPDTWSENHKAAVAAIKETA